MNKQREMASGVVYTLQPRGPEIGKRASTVLMGDVLRTNNRVFLVSLSSLFGLSSLVDGLLKVVLFDQISPGAPSGRLGLPLNFVVGEDLAGRQPSTLATGEDDLHRPIVVGEVTAQAPDVEGSVDVIIPFGQAKHGGGGGPRGSHQPGCQAFVLLLPRGFLSSGNLNYGRQRGR
ncbi:uncharacterized protein LOC118348706 isoform X2 [Juglans regia]|uniref:Uncharacterized protein LOC118348706 isoform X2 n=1 Tax=Juglans regia TaxID=51240 RepID=A0A6P9EHA4_JUGRE|nr:uncharacterized protein LOC118348706 isoform X2 [Juglans regia]